MTSSRFCLLATSSTLIAIGWSASVGAQTTDTVRSSQVEDIIVTAQKRSENLQKVPIAISAVSSEALGQAAITNTRDLQATLPGLQLNQSLGSAQTFVRGVGQTIGQVGTEPPVSVYIDGIYLPQSHSSLFSFNNIEQISLLKGPQGTLFGRNTTGGVLQITTKNPSRQTEFSADVGYASFGTVSGHVYASGGLSEAVAVSIAAHGTDQDGYGRNIAVNNASDDFLKNKEWGVQGKLLWSPSDSTDITLNALYGYQKNTSAMASGVYPGSLGPLGNRYLGFYTFNLDVDPYFRTKQTLASLKIEHDFGALRLTSISGVHHLKEQTLFVSNGLPFGAAPSLWSDQDNSSTSYTQELNLQSPSGDDFQWTVGLFYFNDRTRTDFPVFLNTAHFLRFKSVQDTKSFAAFAQATVPITTDLRLTGGFRYTIDKKDATGQSLNAAGVATATYDQIGASRTPPFVPRLKTEKPTYRIAVDYDLTPDALAYASFTRGYKSGTLSLSDFNNPPVGPEYVDSYELGFKTQLFDRRLRLNIAAFYSDYQDMQIRAFRTVAALVNAASSRIKGVDVDFQAIITPNFSISGGFEILDAEFKKFDNFTCAVPRSTGGNIQNVLCDVSGNDLPRAPTFAGNIAPSYTIDLAGGGSVRLSTNIYHNSGFVWDPDGRLRQDAYTTISASARLTLPGDHWSIDVWGRNLTKERVFGTGITGGVDVYTPGQPRMFGVTLGYRM